MLSATVNLHIIMCHVLAWERGLSVPEAKALITWHMNITLLAYEVLLRYIALSLLYLRKYSIIMIRI